MEQMTKKRLKAIMIDSAISSAVSFTAEYFLKKKFKNEAFYSVVLPMATQYALEYAQLKTSGQTLGYKVMGIKLENQDGNDVTDKQILNRMLHRDTTSTWAYIKDRKNFATAEGEILPHDARVGTVVKDVKN